MYAGDSCDLDVPFYDMCNTQLCVGLFAFRPLSLIGEILLVGHTYCWSLMPGLPLHFRLYALAFVQPMCPLRLDQSTSFGASILSGVMSLFPCNVL